MRTRTSPVCVRASSDSATAPSGKNATKPDAAGSVMSIPSSVHVAPAPASPREISSDCCAVSDPPMSTRSRTMPGTSRTTDHGSDGRGRLRISSAVKRVVRSVGGGDGTALAGAVSGAVAGPQATRKSRGASIPTELSAIDGACYDEDVAVAARKLPENVPGPFFVDDSCIDCAKCREVAPATFGDTGRGASFVFAQPGDAAARHRALMALVACPTASIGTAPLLDARAATDAFPEAIAPGLYDCGFTAEASFGASSYLLRRDDGNVLVDSPRAAAPLLSAIGRLGGVRRMFLTHGDDVADHRRFAAAFGCTRILHEGDITPGTASVEHILRGRDPIDLARGLTIIPVPGHTRGSAALLADETLLFTGDHVWGSEDGQELEASRSVCWYSWPEQRRSLERLLDLRFEWVLPGHGRRFRAPSAAAMRAALERLLRSLPN